MAKERRRLAAIVAADVVGYSRLMGGDESGTLARLREHRARRFAPTLGRHGGRLVKLAGDGALVEFTSAVDALAAAIEFQSMMTAANAGQAADTAIVFRIGLHIGDLIVDGDDLYGDGVNVAARLEAEAPPGGIVVSGAVHEAVAGRLKASFHDFGELTLRNIARAVRAYRVDWDTADWPAPAAAAAMALEPAEPGSQAASDKPSIAVLPFTNMSGDPEQEYFADGIAEDLTTALSRFRQFDVIARNSTFTYKGQAVDVRQVGRELGVRYVLEGSVRKAGDRVRITAQLIDTESGGHVWADRYDARLADIFEVQDEITNTIAAAVTPAFAIAELQRVSRAHPGNLDAWDLALRSGQFLGLGGPAHFAEARKLAERALLLDARNIAALANLAFCHVIGGWSGYMASPIESIAKGIEAARLALQEDNTDAVSLTSLGLGLLAARQFDESLDALRQAVALNPNYASGHAVYGIALGYCGRYDDGRAEMERALRLSPRDPATGLWLANIAPGAFAAGRYDDGVVHARRATQAAPNFMGAHRGLAANLAALDRLDEARREVAEVLRILPGVTVGITRATMPIRDAEARERYCAALARAGLPE